MRTNRRKKLTLRMARSFARLRAAATTHKKLPRPELLVMVLALFVATIMLGQPAQASHLPYQPGCNDDGHGMIVCVDPPGVFCNAPYTWDPVARTCLHRPVPASCIQPMWWSQQYQKCMAPPEISTPDPQPKPQQPLCAVRITWDRAKPAEPVVDVASSNCSQTMARAIAAALSELVGN
jgi:hypothetical protein